MTRMKTLFFGNQKFLFFHHERPRLANIRPISPRGIMATPMIKRALQGSLITIAPAARGPEAMTRAPLFERI
jgi:hypothetical protein